MRRIVAIALAAGALLGVAATASARTTPVHPPRIKGQTPSTSLNWAGYAVYGQTFSDVKGNWTQPSANCATSSPKSGHGHGHGNHGGGATTAPYTAASFWIGLDGYKSSTVEQTGTDADCNGGTPSYYAWYELYPAAPVRLDPSQYPVAPTDKLSAEVDAGNGSLTISDSTQNWTFTTTVDFGGDALSSAEWIAEAPSHGRSLPLTDFGTVTFTKVAADGKAITSYSYDAITMVAHNGTVRAKPGALGSSGASFGVTWNHL